MSNQLEELKAEWKAERRALTPHLPLKKDAHGNWAISHQGRAVSIVRLRCHYSRVSNKVSFREFGYRVDGGSLRDGFLSAQQAARAAVQMIEHYPEYAAF